MGYSPSIFTTRPVALVLVELRHAVCRQWAEHVVLDESRLDLYSLRPISMYRTTMSVHGARKNSTEDISNEYGSLLASPHVDSSGMIVPSCSRPYTSPICMACTNQYDKWWLLSYPTQCTEGFAMTEKIEGYLGHEIIFIFLPSTALQSPSTHTYNWHWNTQPRVNFFSARVKPF